MIVGISFYACTPAPKYRSRGPQLEPAASRAVPAGKSAPALAIRLTPPVRNYDPRRITSPFGERINPHFPGGRRHDGIDIGAVAGEEIIAAASGIVVFAGRQRGYGNIVIIDHGRGITTVYAHLFYACVRKGESVGAGRRIGRAGKRGRATGVHLHFELRRDGVPIDPAPYL
jgi:murein DD-endopeptidase MepM/ murein hydrolase activator NlpD